MFSISPSTVRKCLQAMTLSLVLALSTLVLGNRVSADEQPSYATPQAAVQALVDALHSEDPAPAVVTILGPDGGDIVDSGDPVDDEARRARFLAAYDEAHQIEQDGDAKATLVIGKDEFPFPIPIVAENGKWHWDTAAGVDEILTRRIGENELSAIEVMRVYVAAQLEYAETERDGKGIQYARRLMSNKGRKDGLYWPTGEGEKHSPIGPLIAEAQSEGYKRRVDGEDQHPAYHGYVYRMLYAQGANAADGARDYVVNDRMIGGFALIATPAEYGKSGVMTFIVNQDGIVYEKDLGPATAAEAERIKLFDPDASWRKVDE
ncbi:MAG: DUF2950 domain-containing protein [Hyphomicrobiaceae bacterium]